jgi:hypothetical protein
VRRSASRFDGRSEMCGEKVCYYSGWHGISLDRKQWHFAGKSTSCGFLTSITFPDVDACVLLFPPWAMLSPVLQSVVLFFNHSCISFPSPSTCAASTGASLSLACLPAT